MNFQPVIEIWKISDLMVIKDKVTIFPHQRVKKLTKNSNITLIKSVLLGDLDTPFKLCDIKSCLDNHPEDFDYFNPALLEGFTYSIEDCQHRLGALYDKVSDDDFIGEFENRKQEFYDSEIEVHIYRTTSAQDLIRKFGKTNSGKKIKTSEMVWKILNRFNLDIKELFITPKDYVGTLYNVANKSLSFERIFYGNVIKMIKVCASYEGLIDNTSTSDSSIISFVENDHNIYDFVNILNIFDEWIDLIKVKDKKSEFCFQSNLFFILHITKTNNIKMDRDKIIELADSLIDTRSSAGPRYQVILNQLTADK